ncbi:hypothetical protein CKY12_20960 [Photorhabdus sp. S12-55]|nr:hypothetical protein A4R40_16115 [Photorhabdus laumondii subsp. laumondii]RAW68200.1 hypothetical protein CKY14_19795 [Photorhabdus sp. S14-60]RAW70370.1 hypothetical protein CKY15_11890 [Photorhabdus sp. S7-51]RAW77471.1 hypothetical protein CKY06_12385 [Photorhabdus sp. S15-56]RAW80653.1 hypothetical protein CKY09_20755 [Photorhabdus sp. S5P8-50]RAW80891.1 hypothetical protein CKY12_20960 [Photorhabdus sp. S12-55]
MLWFIFPVFFLIHMLFLSPVILFVDILIICRIVKRGGWKKYKIVFFLIPGVLLMSVLVIGVTSAVIMLFGFLCDHFG